MTEKVPLNFTEDDVMVVASNIFDAEATLGAEAIELCNWLLRFRCASEELRVFVAILADCMTNSSPPWATYCALMDFRLVVLEKRPGVRPVGIAETLRPSLAKLVMRAAGDQFKTVCGNLQLCAGLEANIDGTTHTVGQKRIEVLRAR